MAYSGYIRRTFVDAAKSNVSPDDADAGMSQAQAPAQALLQSLLSFKKPANPLAQALSNSKKKKKKVTF